MTYSMAERFHCDVKYLYSTVEVWIHIPGGFGLHKEITGLSFWSKFTTDIQLFLWT